jgi:AAA domain
VAAGGVGKSSLRLLQYISLALGRPLCSQHVFRRCRVLLISLEDDDDELQRRIQAVLLHYDIPRSELKGWLFCKYVKRSKLAELEDRERVTGPPNKKSAMPSCALNPIWLRSTHS